MRSFSIHSMPERLSSASRLTAASAVSEALWASAAGLFRCGSKYEVESNECSSQQGQPAEIAEKDETSLAEILRRAAQLLLEIYPEQAVESWQPAEPADLGRFRIPESDWRTAAHDIEIGEAKTVMD